MADRGRRYEWTVVNYRKGRRRDRAPSPSPPRPAPSNHRYAQPFRSRRTYASAARAGRGARTGRSGSLRRYGRRQSDNRNRRNTSARAWRPRTDNRDKRRYVQGSSGTRRDRRTGAPPSTDPDFSLKTRIIHRIIKAAHHLKNVTAQETPASIAKMTYSLTSTIKPAAPSATTRSLIEGNAKYWEQNTIMILRDHYHDSMQNDIQILIQLSTSDWQQNFDIAAAWARRHFGRRLQPETLSSTRATLTQRLGVGSTTPPTTRETPLQPPAPERVHISCQTTDDSSPDLTVGQLTTQEITAQPAAPQPQPPAARVMTVTAEVHAPPRQSTELTATPASVRQTTTAATTTDQRRESPAARVMTVTAEVHAPPRQSTELTTTPASVRQTTTAATMTDQGWDWSPEIQQEAQENQTPPLPFPLVPLPAPLLSSSSPPSLPPPPPPPPSSPHSFLSQLSSSPPSLSPSPPPLSPILPLIQAPPKEQRISRLPRSTPGLPTATPGPPRPPPPHITSQPTAEKEDDVLIDLTPEPEPRVRNRPTRATSSSSATPVNQPPPGAPSLSLPPRSRLTLRSKQGQLQFGSSTTPATSSHTLTRRPTRHINTTRKMKEWCLTARKKWLIIGDSNLARFPPFQEADLQIDSFPGATFRHAEAILARTNVTTTVQKVILAFGLNNRAQKAEQTTIKQTQRAMRMAKLAFPQARILVPEINFSRALPHREQENLRRLNTYIVNNYHFIPQLPRMHFSTDRDAVHWTHATAKEMLDHWIQHLK